MRSGGAGELGLTEVQSLLLARHPEDYYLLAVAGAAYAAGHPAGYAAALAAVRAGQAGGTAATGRGCPERGQTVYFDGELDYVDL